MVRESDVSRNMTGVTLLTNKTGPLYDYLTNAD